MVEVNLKRNLPKSILFVDDEQDLGYLMSQWFSQIDKVKVDCAHSGEEAWKTAQEFHYDFIVLDWKIDGKLDGLALVNRFRQHRYYHDVPVLVISGFLSKKEFSIVEEFPLTGIFEKPLQEQAFFKSIANLNQDCTWYKKQQATITKSIEKCVKNEQVLTQLIVKMLHKTNNPAVMLTLVGKALLNLGVEDKAEMVFLKALEKKPSSAFLNNELGKIYLKKGSLDEASKYFEKALMHSPDNIERLCNLGNIELQKMHLDKAESYFNRASSIDQGDKSAESGKILSDNISEWLKEQDSIPANFASMLNSIGISMARKGSFNKCIEHYQSALKHVYTDSLKAKVSFNLGLAYLRWRKAGKANSWFKTALSHDPTFEKANQWIDKLSNPQPSRKARDAEQAILAELSQEDYSSTNDDFENFAMPSPLVGDFVSREGGDQLNYNSGGGTLDFLDERMGHHNIDGDDGGYNISDKLFTYIDRTPVPSKCLAISKNKLEIQTNTEVKIDCKLVLIVDDKGYEFDIISNTPSQADDVFGFRMILHAADKGIDLTEILDNDS